MTTPTALYVVAGVFVLTMACMALALWIERRHTNRLVHQLQTVVARIAEDHYSWPVGRTPEEIAQFVAEVRQREAEAAHK